MNKTETAQLDRITFPGSCFHKWSFFVMAFAALVLFSGPDLCAQFADFPPDDVSSTMDRDQMLWQLGISLPDLPPRATDPNAPGYSYPSDPDNPEGNWRDNYGNTIIRSIFGLWNNYDDYSSGYFPGPDSLRVGHYTPINLLQMKGTGRIISTPEEWWKLRRPEILRDVQHEVWGTLPGDSILPSVSWTTEISNGGRGPAAYIQKTITGTIDVSRYPQVRDVPKITAVLRTPAVAADLVPVMVVIGMGLDRYWEKCWPEGWGVCIFNPGDLQPDNGEGLTSYLVGLCNRGNWRKPGDWGVLAAWGWGISRLVDYFETDPQVDAGRIGVTGHSRFGKATLVTMAYDERIFIGFPSDAGSLGTKMNRRHWGQDVENSGWDREYHWTAGNFFKWMGPLHEGQYLPRKLENMPVDAHSLLSLCAPRPVFMNCGNHSTWTDPYGIYLTALGASPVYELLGHRGVIMNDPKPRLETGYIDGDIGYRYHDGGHTNEPDWPDFWNFARKYTDMPVLWLSPTELAFDSGSGGTGTFVVNSDTKWSIECGTPWVRISKLAGTGTDTIRVTVTAANKAKEGRSARLVILAIGLRDQYVSVNQGSAKPTLTGTIPEPTLDDAEYSFTGMKISSNTSWSLLTREPWLYAEPAGGINNAEVKLIAAANAGVEPRRAEVILRSPGLADRVLSLTQEGAEPRLDLRGSDFRPVSEIRIPADVDSTVNFFAITNSTAEFSSSEDWLTISVQFNKNWQFYSVTLSASGNPGTQERTALVTVTVPGLEPRVITVIQAPGSLPDAVSPITFKCPLNTGNQPNMPSGT
jgi:hypothetical protein